MRLSCPIFVGTNLSVIKLATLVITASFLSRGLVVFGPQMRSPWKEKKKEKEQDGRDRREEQEITADAMRNDNIH
jgi:hypothetical protein